MKVKTISRNDEDYTRSNTRDLYKVHRNMNPAQHPFEKAREYTRALNATKLERMFAKPFMGALSGHTDGVFCLAKHPTKVTTVLSGACDGEIKVWSLKNLDEQWSVNAHKGYVRGLSVGPYGDHFVSVGEDQTVKTWALETADSEASKHTPTNVWLGKHAFTGVDHHRRKGLFATGGSVVEVWDHHRSEPVHNFSWGADTITAVKFNSVEVDVFASCATDRSLVLYDIRMGSPLKKLIMQMRTNAICWNPMEAFNFTAANEDHNLYTYDMRKMDTALNVHKDHVSAVLAIDYSPTGKEFVTGAYDRSLRIYGTSEGHSREVYHTKRMQRIFAVLWSQDAKYVLSGSDETNVRLWKAQAAEKLGTLAPREKASLHYAEKLKETFKHHPEIRRISRHRHVPKAIMKAAESKRTIIESEKRKVDNRRRHSKPGKVPYVPERKKPVVALQD
eukprot:comp11710_c0_seq1/m.6274 comp11710_c0_seq1/g.6274  ORF comp11710_c0_seq1/g.6274 comp11710_c0_seq1/m.6274 type:complete len:447 (-) comp11710_c0_seq1:479-1819(-)